ncbi:MAG TPA: hypothetical protein VMY99_01215 [Nevskiaceae bacterium]|nr:hypothetical protein [Nevskiaceae bacterium]
MPAAKEPVQAGGGRTPTPAVKLYQFTVPRTMPTVRKDGTDDIDQEILREHRLQNDDTQQNIKLKRVTLNRLFIFLAIETSVIFLFAFFQAIGWPHKFDLEEWSFRLLVTATIAQITGMLFVAVRYLFPKGKN